MSETSDVVRPTLEALNSIPGCVAFRIHSGRVKVRGGWMHLGESGLPDIGAVVRERPVFFEAKDVKGLVSEDQLKQHARIRRAGADVFVIRSPREAVDVVRAILDEGRAV